MFKMPMDLSVEQNRTNHAKTMANSAMLETSRDVSAGPFDVRAVDNASFCTTGIVGRIMVVDDEESIRDTLGDYLAIHGYEVTLARNGIEALDKLSAGEFDCIISDLHMPGMGGARLLEEIRKRDGNVWLIVMSGFLGCHMGAGSALICANDYLAKPFLFEELRGRIERVMNRKITVKDVFVVET